MNRFIMTIAGAALVFAGAGEAQAQTQTSKHYQMMRLVPSAQCASDSCTATFPVVPANRELRLSSMSCRIAGDNANFGSGQVNVLDASNVVKFAVPVAPNWSSGTGRFAVIQQLDLVVAAGQRPQIQLVLAMSGTTPEMICTLFGTTDAI